MIANQKFQDWNKATKDELLAKMYSEIAHIPGAKERGRILIRGSRICDYWTETSDMDIEVVLPRELYMYNGVQPLRGSFDFHGVRVNWTVRPKFNIRGNPVWETWFGFRLPYVDLATGEYNEGLKEDLERYLQERKPERLQD